jgi:antirestriction protein
MATTAPAVYVGTYRKYNNGSLLGKWIDLNEYQDAEEFYQACAALHWDESDPEFMFQDWEGIPNQFICESGLLPEYWDYLKALEHSHLDAEVFAAASELDIHYQMVEELYQGQYDSDEDFAYQLADDLGLVPQGNHWPASYIDWGRAARDLMMDYSESGGYYFRTSY